MRCKPPDTRFYTELRDLNAGFLALIADPAVTWHGPLFGLGAGIVAALRGLSNTQLEFIASTPCPLVRFETMPPPNRVADARPGARRPDGRWLESARLFSTELIMYLWQMARQDRLTAALCFGPESGRVSRMAEMSFREIQECAGPAVDQLQARFAHHARFWPDLIRAARSADPDFQYLSRLTIIPLALAESSAILR
jgi:hypothetical protein